MNTLTVIALERSIIITNRNNWVIKSSFKAVRSAVCFTWVYSAVWAVSPVLGWGRYMVEGSMNSCTVDVISQEPKYKSFLLALLIGCFYIQLIIIITSYASIYAKVVIHGREIARLVDEINRKPFSNIPQSKWSRESTYRRKQRKELNTAKISAGIILMFCVSWTPYAVVAMVGCFGDPKYITPLVAAIPGLCAKSSTAINPILYALWHPKYRSKIFKNKSSTPSTTLTNYKYKSVLTHRRFCNATGGSSGTLAQSEENVRVNVQTENKSNENENVFCEL